MTKKKINATVRVLSSGEVADYCGVHFRTVIRWIEKGSLKAYKLPSRGNNRIEEKDFIEFLTTHNMPIPEDFQENDKCKRILIVEDERAMAMTIKRILTVGGYETEIASDGFQAGTKLASYQPAVMTLDLSMPHMDGFTVLNHIRQQDQYKELKIIVISALSDEKLLKAKQAGADFCLSKPFKKEQLLTVLDKLTS